jgi:polyhydroxyalkanoate synthesis repressor PhaR
VITRYGNRRLYDPSLSRCVTVDEIAEAVRHGEDVRVVDGDSGEDLTRRVFTQIILEQANARQLELLPVELLRALIALRSGPAARWLEQYLSAGAQFLERQLSATGPAARLVQESVDSLFPWLKPETWMPIEVPPEAAPKPPSGDEPPHKEVQEEISELQRRLAELSARVKRR